MSQDNPGDVLLRVRAGDRLPVSCSNILDPPQVNGVVYVILLVDIAWQHQGDHFERRGRHRRIREKLEYEFENGMDGVSAYMKSSHQFLPGLHRELRIHAAENFFTALRIHGCQVAHQFVARSPFRILAQTDADRQKRGDDPNSDVCRGHERNKEAKGLKDNQRLQLYSVTTVTLRAYIAVGRFAVRSAPLSLNSARWSRLSQRGGYNQRSDLRQ
jgi:hypothetical protein